MAARKDKKIKLVSSEGTGVYYTTTNSSSEKKLVLKKYDNKLKKHVEFKQSKIK